MRTIPLRQRLDASLAIARRYIGGAYRLQELGGVSCPDGLRYPARDQLTQHSLQSAHDLGAGAAQVTMTLGPTAEYEHHPAQQSLVA
jgi:hypothetical protein